MSTNNTLWLVGDSTPYSLPYACGLSAYNVAINDTFITLRAGQAGCPGQCSGFDYSCAEMASTKKSAYGYYECTMKPSAVPGTITTCALVSSTRSPYEEIHIKFIGNDTSHISIGYVAKGTVYQTGPVLLTFRAETDFHSYGFEWESNYIKWYVDGKEVSSEMGSRPLPTTPSRYVINFLVEESGVITDDSAIYTDPNVNRVFTPPANGIVESYFKNVSYTPVIYESCDNASGIVPGQANWTGYDNEACSTAPVSIVYDDTLATGWSDIGSSPTHSLKANAYVHSGSTSMSWDVLPGTLLSLSTSGTISQTAFYGFEFWVFGGGKSGQQITASLLLAGGGQSNPVNLNQVLTSGIQPWAWSRVLLPFNIFGVSPSSVITGLVLNAVGDTFEGTLYIDDFILNQQHPFCTNRTMIVYDDKLSSGFLDWSWGTYSLTSTATVHSGSYAIEWDLYNNDGIKFHALTPLDTTIWQGVSLYVNYQKLRGWQITIAVTSNDKAMGTVGLLDYFSGTFPPGDWVKVVIPFSEFGVTPGTPVDGIQLVCNTDQYQGTMYIDDVSFVSTISLGSANPAARVVAAFSVILLQVLAVFMLL